MLQRIPPVNLSPTPSESDTSLTFDQREVIGGEDSECQSLTGKGEEEEEREYPRHVRCYSKEDMKGVLYRTPVSGGNVSEEGEERGRKETKERARSYKLSVSLSLYSIFRISLLLGVNPLMITETLRVTISVLLTNLMDYHPQQEGKPLFLFLHY